MLVSVISLQNTRFPMKGVSMKAKYIKIVKILVFFIVLLLHLNITVSAEKQSKTIIIVTDQLDFNTIEDLNFDSEISLGLMNTRVSNVFKNNEESYFMTMATGRRVELKDGLFKGVKKYNNHLIVEGYEDIITSLDEYYNNFSKEIEFLSDTLANKGIHIGYMGNDSSALLAADKRGIINYGYLDPIYETDWLIGKTDEILTKADLLILYFPINGSKDNLKVLEEYVNRLHVDNIMIFPKKVSGDIADIRNKTLVPIIYLTSNESSKILTSDSTMREGLITNMDILPELTRIYNIATSTCTGHEIYSTGNFIDKSDLIQKNKDNLNKTLNLVIVKYIFHGIVIFTQLYIFYDMYRYKENLRNRLHRYDLLMNRIIIYIFLSLLLGTLIPGRNIFIYCISILLLSHIIDTYMKKKNMNYHELFPILTNILLIVAVYTKPELIYHSFYGFNNIITGGRFYGLNNETMAILVTTSIITLFWVKNKMKSRIVNLMILIPYFSVILLALSDKYAANFGGFLASIAIFVMLLYTFLFDKSINRKSIITITAFGVLVFILGLAIELSNSPNGHVGALYFRIKTLGLYELIDMVFKKINQLLLITISPPWSIIFVGQLYFISKFARNNKKLIEIIKKTYPNIQSELLIIFIGSLLVFAFNDTGVIAFVYMNTYLIRMLIHLKLKFER